MFLGKKSSIEAHLVYKYDASWNILDTLQFFLIKKKLAYLLKNYGRTTLMLRKIRRLVRDRLEKDKYCVRIIYELYGTDGSVRIYKRW